MKSVAVIKSKQGFYKFWYGIISEIIRNAPIIKKFQYRESKVAQNFQWNVKNNSAVQMSCERNKRPNDCDCC